MNLKKIIRHNPLMKKLIVKLNPYELSVPPGHYYSPIPDLAAIRENEARIFNNKMPEGIDFNDKRHKELLGEFKRFHDQLPFEEEASEKFRYYYKNEMYSHSSGSLLFCFLQYLRPKKVIEVGSGYSSALMLDVNNLFMNNNMQLTFIEPYPARLKRLLRTEDYAQVTIHEKKLEEVDLSIFESLEENDILFIDSTHVSKIGSDVNKILFEIIPRLKKGVYVHFHDIMYPFEYPKEWIYNGYFWNEIYILRAFLMYNNTFSIQFFNTYALEKFVELNQQLPLFSKNIGGCLWLKKEN